VSNENGNQKERDCPWEFILKTAREMSEEMQQEDAVRKQLVGDHLPGRHHVDAELQRYGLDTMKGKVN